MLVAKVDCNHPSWLLGRKISIPPHSSTPPGSACRVFTSPPPPLVIRKLQGGGTSILVPNLILLHVLCQSNEIFKIWSSCQPDEKLENIGLTRLGTLGLPGNLSSEKKQLAPL